MRHACAGDVGDAAHGPGEPAVVELQRSRQVGAFAAVGAVPFGGQRGQFPDGVATTVIGSHSKALETTSDLEVPRSAPTMK